MEQHQSLESKLIIEINQTKKTRLHKTEKKDGTNRKKQDSTNQKRQNCTAQQQSRIGSQQYNKKQQSCQKCVQLYNHSCCQIEQLSKLALENSPGWSIGIAGIKSIIDFEYSNIVEDKEFTGKEDNEEDITPFDVVTKTANNPIVDKAVTTLVPKS